MVKERRKKWDPENVALENEMKMTSEAYRERTMEENFSSRKKKYLIHCNLISFAEIGMRAEWLVSSYSAPFSFLSIMIWMTWFHIGTSFVGMLVMHIWVVRCSVKHIGLVWKCTPALDDCDPEAPAILMGENWIASLVPLNEQCTLCHFHFGWNVIARVGF